MNAFKYALVFVIACLVSAPSVMAQRGGPRISPHETISTVVDGNRVMIIYGRPYSKNPRGTDIRKIWGGLVPYGQIWRTGSDEATIMITANSIVLGGATIPAGAYTLWTLPNADGTAKLIVNKQIGQWGIPMRPGIDGHDEKQDIASVDLKKDTIEKQVDQFTMAIEAAPGGAGNGGLIKLTWETTQFSVAFTVKK